jgi:hypothetical protein
VKRSSLTMDKFAATIGLDWADARHAICLQVAGAEQREFAVLEHRPESIAAWARALVRQMLHNIVESWQLHIIPKTSTMVLVVLRATLLMIDLAVYATRQSQHQTQPEHSLVLW